MDVIGAVWILALVAVYFVPAIVAGLRDHHQLLAIWVLNVLLGWTGLGWIVALVWACTAVRRVAQVAGEGAVVSR
jgi:T4 superinfection immunity protein